MAEYKCVTELIGKTPLLALERYAAASGADAELLAKLEYLNPAGSAKDRIALEMIDDAEARGALKPGSTIIEPTSGNTGIGLAMVGAVRGYRVILTMPESMSAERRALLRAYGAELILTPAGEGMSGAIKRAEQLEKETPGAFMPRQFDNAANAAAHYKTTGPELFAAAEGRIDIFVAGVGTGGTISGVGRYLREKLPNIKIVAVEPDTSPVLSGGKAGAHGIQGIGAGFVPTVLDTTVYDEVLPVPTEAAIATAKALTKTEGVLTGISSGAALYAATLLAKRPENKGKRIAVLLPDSGDRYLSV